ncbi:YbaB/EbfC family DNA-binding protein [Nocardia panacis]|uniref:YbaB/EbfC family DNA-binding protein n=1 Tax=Nocardia panacis TaxID=2340916 RepID=A0A3A4K7V2_9NOCA|nr:YbaB/EbfC family nucleoid-associated protein [Nocardia panacis]RJO75104.1 YbaB/EbfC family DNA-binding protein [Nocardia panacis]
MANEAAKAELAELLTSVQTGIAEIARMQREHAKLTASATVAGKRVTVVVNANGDVIQTVLGRNADELTHAQLAQAFTEAQQQAAAAVRARTKAMVAQVRQKNARLPGLSDFVPGLPDLRELIPDPPQPSLDPPAARARAVVVDDGAAGMEFTDVEQLDRDSGGSDVANSGW